MKTYSLKIKDISRGWYVVDAENQILGRLATEVARRLSGKHKVLYSPNLDNGDYVVVVNADKFKVTGNKLLDKKYYRHSGYKGGLKVRSLEKMIEEKPTDIIRKAVKGMLPKTALGRKMAKKLKIYTTSDHPHIAQKPCELKL
jgi:large subunit ribosomal protein L13